MFWKHVFMIWILYDLHNLGLNGGDNIKLPTCDWPTEKGQLCIQCVYFSLFACVSNCVNVFLEWEVILWSVYLCWPVTSGGGWVVTPDRRNLILQQNSTTFKCLHLTSQSGLWKIGQLCGLYACICVFAIPFDSCALLAILALVPFAGVGILCICVCVCSCAQQRGILSWKDLLER